MSITLDLRAYAHELGIPLVGITSAEPFLDLREILIRRRSAGKQCPFEYDDIEKRCDPRLVLPGARSIVAVGIPYLSKPVPIPGNAPRGRIARVAWGQDYHRVVGEALEKLARFLRKHCPGMEYRSMVDTGPLADRAVARRAGIGWQGKNCAIITKPLGSWLFLGEMLTSLPLEPDPPVEKDCGECTRCLKACPTGALASPYNIDPHQCLSYITQARGFIPGEFRHLMGNRIYGCDACQEACPHNREAGKDGHPAFLPAGDCHVPNLTDLLHMSKDEFARQYASTSAGWCGRQVLRRNAAVALGNTGDPDAVPSLVAALEDPSAVLRGHAAWALGRIGGTAAKTALQSARAKENDPLVEAEIRHALETV